MSRTIFQILADDVLSSRNIPIREQDVVALVSLPNGRKILVPADRRLHNTSHIMGICTGLNNYEDSNISFISLCGYEFPEEKCQFVEIMDSFKFKVPLQMIKFKTKSLLEDEEISTISVNEYLTFGTSKSAGKLVKKEHPLLPTMGVIMSVDKHDDSIWVYFNNMHDLWEPPSEYIDKIAMSNLSVIPETIGYSEMEWFED